MMTKSFYQMIIDVKYVLKTFKNKNKSNVWYCGVVDRSTPDQRMPVNLLGRGRGANTYHESIINLLFLYQYPPTGP